jgi:hypothetical protein
MHRICWVLFFFCLSKKQKCSICWWPVHGPFPFPPNFVHMDGKDTTLSAQLAVSTAHGKCAFERLSLSVRQQALKSILETRKLGLMAEFPPSHSLHHVKYAERHMFRILNIDEIENQLHDCDHLCDANLLRPW